ncbi:type II secretion system GspH family protein [Candidatus Gracilibacteria bacterium]|nr:type II secretion system GspH family protein [Candidatus Gracilibacteria bacterium]
MREYHKYSGFTVIELIVVISIVSILSTLGFTSFFGYQKMARDAARLSDIIQIQKTLDLYMSRNDTLPLPDDSISIQAGGNTIGYQGTFGIEVLRKIRQAGAILDPREGEPYTYYVSRNERDYQILSFMEKNVSEISLHSIFPQVYATDYVGRFPKLFGTKLGIITETESNGYTPIQDLADIQLAGIFDVVSETGVYTSHIDDNKTFEGDASELINMIPNISCERIKELHRDMGNREYTLNPTGIMSTRVFCDMDSL